MLACTLVRSVEVGLAALLVILLCHPDLALPPDLFDAFYLTALGLALGTYVLTFALNDKEQDAALPVLLRATTWVRVATLAIGVRFLLLEPILAPWLGAKVRHPEHPLGPDLYQGLVPDFFRLVLDADVVQTALLFLVLGLCLLAATAHVTRRWTVRAALFLLDGIPHRESDLAERLQSLSELEDGRRAIARESSLNQEMVLAGGSLVKELMVLGLFAWVGLVSQALLQPYAPSYPDYRMIFSYGLLSLAPGFFTWATAARLMARRDRACACGTCGGRLSPVALSLALSAGAGLLVAAVITGHNSLLLGATALVLGALALARPWVANGLPAQVTFEAPHRKVRAYTLTVPKLVTQVFLVTAAVCLLAPPAWLLGLALLWAAFRPPFDLPRCVRTTVETLGDARRRWRSYAPKEKEQRRAERPLPDPATYTDVDILCVEVGRGILPIVDPNQGALLVKMVEPLRQEIAKARGLLLPGVRFRDNLGLALRDYRILIRGHVVAGGQALGNEPATVVAAELRRVVDENLHRLVGLRELEAMLATTVSPRLVESLIPYRLTLSVLAAVLSRLLEEGVPKLGLERILEVIARHIDVHRDPGELAELVREDAAEELCAEHKQITRRVPRLLAKKVPEELVAGLGGSGDLETREALRQWLREQKLSGRTVLMTSPDARRRVFQIARSCLSGRVTVLCDRQVPAALNVVFI